MRCFLFSNNIELSRAKEYFLFIFSFLLEYYITYWKRVKKAEYYINFFN